MSLKSWITLQATVFVQWCVDGTLFNCFNELSHPFVMLVSNSHYVFSFSSHFFKARWKKELCPFFKGTKLCSFSKKEKKIPNPSAEYWDTLTVMILQWKETMLKKMTMLTLHLTLWNRTVLSLWKEGSILALKEPIIWGPILLLGSMQTVMTSPCTTVPSATGLS